MKTICVSQLFALVFLIGYDQSVLAPPGVSSNTPTIQISPDSLFYETSASYDTLLVVNTGNIDLVIDSVKTAKPFGYFVQVVTKDTVFDWSVFLSLDIDQFARKRLILAPEDTAQLIISSPDPCPICSNLFFEFFRDTLFVFSNDSARNPVSIIASGDGLPSAVQEKNSDIPDDFFLYQNYPNPFNPTTRILFSVPFTTAVSMVIYNSLGQEVRTIVQRQFEAGEHQVIWNGRDDNNRRLANGLYFLRMIVPQGARLQYAKTIRMILLE